VIANVVILAWVTLQRAAELALSRHNTNRLIAQGAREHSPGHYPLIVTVHLAWLCSMWLLAPVRSINVFWLAMFVLIEIARFWVMASLGSRWTTRIIILPGAPLVSRGPYRWINHPNYWVVTAEIVVLPLVFGLRQVALIFALLNALIISIRIREENQALGRNQRG
jgi:methyltransferase